MPAFWRRLSVAIGNRVIWADEPDRWRQDAKDDKISLGIVGGGASSASPNPRSIDRTRRNCSSATSFMRGRNIVFPHWRFDQNATEYAAANPRNATAQAKPATTSSTPA